MADTLKILHLTDTHIFSDPHQKLVGINPRYNLEQIVAQIIQELPHKSPDLLIITGDISQDYSPASYASTLEILQQLPCPITATIGNHDALTTFTTFFGNPTWIINNFSATCNWQVLLVNSRQKQQVMGNLSDDTLDFLHQELAANNNKFTIIFLHHHTLPVGSPWLDKIKLKNSEQFLALLAKYPNIKVVVCGHVHQAFTMVHNNILFITSPATSCQFIPNMENFELDILMPGYRWLYLNDDGTIDTEVVRLPYDKKLIPDLTCREF